MTDGIHGGDAPFSRRIAVSEVPPEGLDLDIAATPAECAALAKLNGLPAVLSLNAPVRLRRWRGDGLEVTGEIRARLRQTCVVTLEEFESDIREDIDLRFAAPRAAAPPKSRRHADVEEQEHDALADDPPDPIVNGTVDIGAAAAEFLTLALDPYPRKPGAEFVEPAPAEPVAKASPFAQLLGRQTGKRGEG